MIALLRERQFHRVQGELAVQYGRKAHEAKNETWILTLHVSPDWASLEKYTDGKYVIASIPVLDFESNGMSLYVSQYNALTTRKADLLALNGKYQDALQTYRLLQRFDNCGNNMPDTLGERIACVEKLLSSEESENQLKRLKELTTNYGRCALEILETKQAIIITNLLELSFRKSRK